MTKYRYSFADSESFSSALDTLVLSRIAVASALGDARSMLELDCEVDRAGHAVLIGSNSKPGELLSRIFMGYLVRELPSGAFKVAIVRPGRATAAGGSSAG